MRSLFARACAGGCITWPLSAAKRNFTMPQLNYMDPNLNVDVPIFAIHGNHDDPAGDGAFSAMDLLAQVMPRLLVAARSYCAPVPRSGSSTILASTSRQRGGCGRGISHAD